MSACLPCISGPDLQHGNQQNHGSDGVHHAAVVRQQGISTSTLPNVELLGVVVVAVVGRVVGHLGLDAGPGRAGVTAAERDSIHQILAVHVAANTAEGIKRKCHVGVMKGHVICYEGLGVKVKWVKGRTLP